MLGMYLLDVVPLITGLCVSFSLMKVVKLGLADFDCSISTFDVLLRDDLNPDVVSDLGTVMLRLFSSDVELVIADNDAMMICEDAEMVLDGDATRLPLAH